MRNPIPITLLALVAVLLLAANALPAEPGGVAAAIDGYALSTAGLPDRGQVDVLAEEELTSPHSYTFAIRPGVFFTTLDGKIEYENLGGHGTSLDADSDLGVGDSEASISGDFHFRFGAHDIWLGGYYFSRSGSGKLANGLAFGEISTVGATEFDTDLQLFHLTARYGFSVFDDEASGIRVSPTFTLHMLDIFMKVDAKSAAGKQSDQIDATTPVPAVGVHGEWHSGDFLVELDVSGFAITLHSFEGTYLEVGAFAHWRPMETFGAFLGYRYIDIESTAKSSGHDYDLTIALSGPVFGIELRF